MILSDFYKRISSRTCGLFCVRIGLYASNQIVQVRATFWMCHSESICGVFRPSGNLNVGFLGLFFSLSSFSSSSSCPCYLYLSFLRRLPILL